MKKHRVLAALSCVGLFALGCRQPESPVALQRAELPMSAKGVSPELTSSKLINGYSVAFTGREFTGTQTTFSYNVSGTGVDPSLSNLTIQLPDCAGTLSGFSPSEAASVGDEPNSGLFGIKWELPLGTGAARDYSVTFPGEIPMGFVRIAVKAGDSSVIGVLPGPCDGFDISGTVFVDKDSSGTREPALEPGIIANVTVSLEDANGNVQTQVSDTNGNYSFKVGEEGDYTIRIDPTTAAEGDFNEQLFESFDATNATSVVVSVGPDSPGNDFGFKPRADEITSDIELGILSTSGEDFKYWTRQFRSAAKGSGQSDFDAGTLLGFLEQIEGLFFDTPYQFTDGNQFNEALAILTDNSRDQLDVLIKQLFVTELNHVSNKGLADLDLQAVLISWGESIVVDRLATAGAVLKPAPGTDDELGSAQDLFTAINEQRGGGDVPDEG
jgi:hypothetical protein